jgi:hypothetical protein
MVELKTPWGPASSSCSSTARFDVVPTTSSLRRRAAPLSRAPPRPPARRGA